jgi:hypothetical protein
MAMTASDQEGAKIDCAIFLILKQKEESAGMTVFSFGCQYLSEFVGVSQLKIECVV